MKIEIEVEDHGLPVALVDFDLSPTETIDVVAARLASQMQMEAADVAAGLSIDGAHLPKEMALHDYLLQGHKLHLKRVCIDLHFETETAMHKFSPRATWERVHLWGCGHFHIPHDLCANLELREGSPSGPALNENVKIGEFPDCKTVWLVKPGPEPNGKRY